MPSHPSRNSDISGHSSFRPAQNFEYANELEFKNEKDHRIPKKKDFDIFANNDSSSSFSDELDRKIIKTSRQHRTRNKRSYNLNSVSRSQNYTTRTPDKNGASPSAVTSYMGDVPASESTTRKRNPFVAGPKRPVNHTRVTSRQVEESFAGGVAKLTFGNLD